MIKYLVTALVFGAAPGFAPAQPAPMQLDLIINDISALRKTLATGCQFDTTRRGSSSSGASKIDGRARIMCAPRCWLKEVMPPKGGPVDRVLGFNPDYGFRVSRELPRTTWNITSLKVGHGHEAASAGVRSTPGEISPDQAALLQTQFLDVEYIPVELLLRHSTFAPLSITRTDNRLLLEFKSDIESALGPDRVTGGKIWFLVDSRHIIDEYLVSINAYGNIATRASLKMTWRETGVLPVPKSYTITYQTSKSETTSFTTEFANWSYDAPDDVAVFRLSHYGLPEPLAEPHTHKWYYVCAAIIGLILIAAGFVIRRRHNKWPPRHKA